MEKKELNQSIYSNESANDSIFNGLMRYIKNWPWFVFFSVLGIILGVVKYKITPKSYQVETKILVKGESNPLASSISFDNILGGSVNSNMENQIEILQSFSNYQRTLNNLNWEVTWFAPGKPNDQELYKFKTLEVAFPLNSRNLKGCQINIIPESNVGYKVAVETKTMVHGIEKKVEFESKGEFGKPFKNDFFNFIIYNKEEISEGEYYFVINDMNILTKDYLERVTVEVANQTSEVIKMQLAGRIPQKEADFLNELNNVFITLGVVEEERNSEMSLNFINDQLSKIKDSLDRFEKEFVEYRKRNNAMDLSQEANFIYSKLEEIESEGFQANMKLDYYENLQRYLDDANQMQKFSTPSVAGINDENLNNMLQKLSELYNRKEVLSYSVKEKSPSYILVEKEIQLIRNDLNENLNSLISNTKTQIAGINKRKKEIESRLIKLPDTEKEFIGIQRNFELTNSTYNYMRKKKAEAELSQASTTPKVQIIDDARPEAAKIVGLGILTNMILGLCLGFILPFLFIYITDIFNTTIQSEEDVENNTSYPVFTSIYQNRMKTKLPVVDKTRSGITESFRALRYHIKNQLGNPDKMVISINSVMPGEGKSFVASNLAAIMAKSDQRVLLVGADMRKPVLENIFNQNGAPGLSTTLDGKNDLKESIIKTKINNLFVILSGDIPSNPTELLESHRFVSFISEVKSQFDCIVIDNAPISLVPDGMIVSKHADLSLFVTRINKSKRKVVNLINKTIDTNHMKNVSIVVNGMPLNSYSKGYIRKGYHQYGMKS